MRLGEHVQVATASGRVEVALADAARLQGDERLHATLEALRALGAGEYLSSVTSAWADERRRQLAQLATDARSEAAELALATGRLSEAQRLADEVLEAEPFREAAWRVRMRVANALGDQDGVIRAYRACERALAELDTTPAPSTRQLLDQLRR